MANINHSDQSPHSARCSPGRVLMIGYEVTGECDSGGRLQQAIVRLGGRWTRPLSCLWYVECIEPAETVAARLAAFVADYEALVVHEVTGSPALQNTLLCWSNPYGSAGFDDGSVIDITGRVARFNGSLGRELAAA